MPLPLNSVSSIPSEGWLFVMYEIRGIVHTYYESPLTQSRLGSR